MAQGYPSERNIEPFRNGGCPDPQDECQYQVPDRFRQMAVLVVVVPAPEITALGM
jgi:hypothetical protein